MVPFTDVILILLETSVLFRLSLNRIGGPSMQHTGR